MNKKGLIIIAIFLFVVFTPHLLLRHNEIPGQLPILVIILFFFSFFYFSKSIVCLFKKKYSDSLISFLIFLLFLSLSLKMEYSFYNVFIVSFLFIIGSIYIIKKGVKEQNQTILLFLLFINLVMILVPDRILYGYIWNEKIWSPAISWSSFKGSPDLTDTFDASTNSGIHFKVNFAYNYPPAIIVTLMDEKLSWTKSNNLYLLKHEQGHFNINEIYARKAIDSIKNSYLKKPSEIAHIINYFADESDKQQDLYDLQTNHCKNQVEQIKWNDGINKSLQIE